MAHDGGDLFDVDRFIEKLLQARTATKHSLVDLHYDEMQTLCHQSQAILMNDSVLLKLRTPIKVCGDIHGQYYDLLRLFESGGFPPESNYLFLGDYVDRGKQSLETICLLLAYKIKYPENFFLLRGNHECAIISKDYGFFDECTNRYNRHLWNLFIQCFDCLPIAAIIDQKIFCCHGGISPDLKSVDDVLGIMRPTGIPDQGLLCDLVWADPEKGLKGYKINDARGISVMYGANEVRNFLATNNLDLICRAHQVVRGGYEYFGYQKLVTIFSAPNYNDNNAGAIMTVDTKLRVSFQIMKPEDENFRYGSLQTGRPVTPPKGTVKNKGKM